MTIRKILATVTIAAALAGLGAPSARACPNCKEAVASQSPEEAARLKNGYFYSIILMVSMPFVLAGTGIFCVVRAMKNGSLPEL